MRTSVHTSWHSMGGRAQSAFTLVELLVVVSIIALSLGIVVPTLGGFFASARGPDSRNLISANLLWARNYAVANSTTSALVFVDDNDDADHLRTLKFFAEMDLTMGAPGDVGFAPIAGREAVYLPNDIVVSANEYDPGDIPSFDRTVIIVFSPQGQLTTLSDIDILVLPNGSTYPGLNSPQESVTNFYLYDFKGSGDPVELYDLGINYYTGTVIEQ